MRPVDTEARPRDVACIEGRAIVKSFGGIHALRGVDFRCLPGEVMALVGENGAGKSTLMRILSGSYMPDSGALLVDGVAGRIASPADARRHGVVTIHQELELFPDMSVAENLALDTMRGGFGWVDRLKMDSDAREILAQLKCEIPVDARVRDLSLADQQFVEIAKAFISQARVLIMDEPTAALTPVEAEQVLRRIEQLRTQGVCVLYISHRLEEVIRIADRIMVMRDGSKVAELEGRGSIDEKTLISHMIGRELHDQPLPKTPARGRPMLSVRDLAIGRSLSGASIDAHAGEIVGIFGLVGSGHEHIGDALFGACEARVSSCRMGTLDRLPSSPKEAIAHGIGFVPADRKMAGLALSLSIRDNMIFPSLDEYSANGFVR